MKLDRHARAYFQKWKDSYVTTRPGAEAARFFDVIMMTEQLPIGAGYG
ncbi:hypothetical protein [Paenibacillus pabuli]|nr:hypothetical protein [Paenibacillus pabuli]MEC0127719.1 hypothetical protein [Paenibacillus pabuli]